MHKQMQKPNPARTNHKNARRQSRNGNNATTEWSRAERALPRDPRDHSTAYAEPGDIEPDYFDDRALDGLPELAEELPTALIKIHAVFTVQHIVTELRYQFEMGNLTRGDREMLAHLGKEIAEELERENLQ